MAPFFAMNSIPNLPDNMIKWDVRFLKLAEHISLWSKDPSTKVGAVITRNLKELVSIGYNGFPKDVTDSLDRLNDRELKYKIVTHGEINAILRAKQDLTGCTIYLWPFLSCSTCTGAIITAGISRIVTIENDNPRWQESFKLSRIMYKESNIPVDLYSME